MNTSWHSYPKVWAIGHAAVAELFYDDVIVQEKVDGSQFSFGVFDGVLKMRSKGQELNIDAPEKMFENAAKTVFRLKDKLVHGYTYRAEYLQKPKHNVLAYDRTPESHIMIFDINSGQESYLSYEEVEAEAKRLGLEVVPLLYSGKVSSAVDLEKLLERTSVLGGQKIEGFVAKNYARFGKDKKALMGKFVSEAFKEKHKKTWKEENPGQNDIVQLLIGQYRTPARWDKAIIHLREAGALEGSPKDIGKIIKEVPKDLLSECEQEIKDQLFQWAFPDLIRGVNRGLAEYYKERLFKSQFEGR
jgi:hypothetical protein